MTDDGTVFELCAQQGEQQDVVRLTRIYTRTGDKGTTRLVGGQEVPKDAVRIEAYGTVDELNAILGLVRSFLASSDADPDARDKLEAWLRRVQNDLFDLGSDLATRIEDRWEGQPLIAAEDVTRLEHDIDELNEVLPPLQSFLLPGGGPINGFLHQARTVCRRAERAVERLDQDEVVEPTVLQYLNRLSDLLFALARLENHRAGVPDVLWERGS